MNTPFFNIITAIGAIGSFIGAMITLLNAVKLVNSVRFKTEKLYGREAEERCEALLQKVPEKAPHAFGPDEYSGGSKATPQFEVERFYFDPQTMPHEWKKLTKTVRYYYKAGDTTMVRGWRF